MRETHHLKYSYKSDCEISRLERKELSIMITKHNSWTPNSTQSLAHPWSPVIQKLDCDKLGRPAFECNWFATLVSTAPQGGAIPISGWLPGWSQPDPEIVTSTLLIHPSFCPRCVAKPSFLATTGLLTVLETASSREKTKDMIELININSNIIVINIEFNSGLTHKGCRANSKSICAPQIRLSR